MENSRFKFRAWHAESEEYCEGTTSNMFGWLQDGQPVILEQYTGLKDCDGTEIYEGDMLSDGSFYWTVVFIDGALWARRNSTVVNIMELKRKRHIAMKEDCIKVVGNIHQNPELIK